MTLSISCLGALATARGEEPPSLVVPAGDFHVGDPVTLSVSVPLSAGEQLVAPDLGASLGKLAVREVRVKPPAPPEGNANGTLEVVVQAFETGTLEVPPIPFQLRTQDGKLREGTSSAAKLEVKSLLPESESERKPADLAPPAELSINRRKLAVLAAVVGSLLVLGALLGWWVMRRLARKRVKPEPPPPPADQQALGDLDRLMASPWLAHGELRRFHIELAAILKRYLERRFEFPAVERTTNEVERELRRLSVDPAAQQPAAQVLRDCDRIKFANEHSTLDSSRERAAMVRGVIERTRLGTVA